MFTKEVFLSYVNDTSSPLVKFHLFADDICIFHYRKNYSKFEQELNIALHNVADWLKANKLTLNVDKSILLFLNLNRNQKSANKNIPLGDDKLKPKDYAKYLGFFIDSKLTKTHLNDKSQAAKRNWDNKDNAKLPTRNTIKTIIFNLYKTLYRLWNTCLGSCDQNPHNQN